MLATREATGVVAPSHCSAMVLIAILLVLAAYGLLCIGWTLKQLLMQSSTPSMAKTLEASSGDPSSYSASSGDPSSSSDRVVTTWTSAAMPPSPARLASSTAAVATTVHAGIWVTKTLTWHLTDNCPRLSTAKGIVHVPDTDDVMLLLTCAGAQCKTCKVHGLSTAVALGGSVAQHSAARARTWAHRA